MIEWLNEPGITMSLTVPVWQCLGVIGICFGIVYCCIPNRRYYRSSDGEVRAVGVRPIGEIIEVFKQLEDGDLIECTMAEYYFKSLWKWRHRSETPAE